MHFSPIFVFLGVAVSGALVNAMTTEAFLSHESRALSSIEGPNDMEVRSQNSVDVKVQLRDLFDEEGLYERDYFDDAAQEFVARFGNDIQDQDAHHGGPSTTKHIHRREPEPIFVDELDDLEERDYDDWLEELDARYYDELEERFKFGMDNVEDVNARELDTFEIDAREPRRHFFCGTVILPHPPPSDY